MTKERRFCLCAASVLLAGMVGGFVSVPVFANGPVDISIVELVEDGSGGYKYWEDITGAMPGETYSAIPQIKNDGSEPVSVTVCISESATNNLGESISLPANTFGININSNWTIDNERATNPSDPASGNCYKYNSELAVGDMTEPLFMEITLSSELGNEYGNSTFNLRLEAEAVGESGSDSEPDSDSESESDAGSTDSGAGSDTSGLNPGNPDTGANTASYFEIVSPVFFSAGVVALFAITVYAIRKFRK